MSTGPPTFIARPKHVDARVVWLFYGGAALVTLLLGATALWTPAPIADPQRYLMGALSVAQSLAFVASALIAVRQRVGLAVIVSGATGIVSLSLAALMTAVETSLHLLGFLGYIVCLCAVFAGRRAALGMTGAAVGAVVLVVALRQGHAALAVVNALMLIATGLLIGLVSDISLTRTLNALRQREQRFERLFNIAADWYWELDDQLRYSLLARTTRTAGHAWVMPQAVGQWPWSEGMAESTPQAWEAHRQVLERRESFRDFVVERPDGHGGKDYISASGEPMFGTDGRFKGYWGVSRIVTAEVRAEQAVLAVAQRYRQLFECSPTPMVAHRQGQTISVNAAAAQLLGYANAESALGAHLTVHYEGADRQRALARLTDMEKLPDGESLPLAEFRLKRLDGSPLQVVATSLRIRLDDGPAMLSIYHDVTARKTAEHALRHSQTLLTQLFDTTPDVVTLTEFVTGRYLMVNDRFTQLLGWSREDALGHSSDDLGITQDLALRAELDRELGEKRFLHDRLMNLRARSGALVPLRISAAVLTFDAVDYSVSVGRDVSQTEQTRQEHEAILKYASVGIGFMRGRDFVQVNPRFEEMFGWPVGSLAGESGAVVWPSEADYAEVACLAGPLLASGKPFESERLMRRRDGSNFWCRLSARFIDPADPSRGGTIWITEDITERRMVQESLATARDAAEAARSVGGRREDPNDHRAA